MYVIKKEHILDDTEFFIRVCVEEVMNEIRDLLPSNITISIANVNDTDYLDDYGGAACFYAIDCIKNKIIKCDVVLYNDFEIYFDRAKDRYYGYEYRGNKFLRSLEVPINKFSLFLFILLHELGHARIIKLFTDSNLQKEYRTLNILTESISQIFDREDISTKVVEEDLVQFVNGIESQSDIFAMNHFMPLWNKVKRYTTGGFKV